MKLVSLFSDFLKNEVNLNATRIDGLETSIEAIKSFVESSNWAPTLDRWAPQGSWAHETIIRPVDRGEFDADLLVFVSHMSGWSAKDYIDTLYDVFKANGTYKDKVKRWSHCITITYANDKKIDVAPVVTNRPGGGGLEVCNRTADAFERTEPEQYTKWLIDRNSWTGSNSFRKVTRLIKYLRDIKTTFTCSSVLLTTMLGYRVTWVDQLGTAFSDVPTALKTIFGRWDDWLQQNASKPSVLNPFLANEDFASNLTEDQYTNLRDMVAKYRGWIDDAYDEADRNESIAKWQRVFGDEFAKDAVIEEAKSVSKSAVLLIEETAGTLVNLPADLITLVKRFGVRALPRGFNNLPHMRRPKWRVAPSPTMAVFVRAELYQSRGFNKLRDLASLEPVLPGQWICFKAYMGGGIALTSHEYDVKWRVTNTDEAAYNANCLRGWFEDSSTRGERWEQLRYRGVHIVEAFVIRKRDNTQVAKSDPFHVAIE